jgi:transposase
VSLPDFDGQTELFGLQMYREQLLGPTDRYRLFAAKIYPVLVKARERLESCYCMDNGRPGVEPVVLLGVSLLQYLERLPDRQAVEHLKYHVGWKYALGQELDSGMFDASVLVRFRERLLAHEEGRLIFEAVQEVLEDAGLVPRRGRQRLDSTYVLGLVRRMSALDCVRESLRLALEELEVELQERPDFWDTLWERYVESRPNYRSSADVLHVRKCVRWGKISGR